MALTGVLPLKVSGFRIFSQDKDTGYDSSIETLHVNGRSALCKPVRQ